MSTASSLLKLIRADVGEVGLRCVLDVGCGNGAFVAACRAQGFDALGIDTGLGAGAQAEGAFLDASPMDLGASHERHFSLATLFDVLEHFPEPLGALGAIGRLVEPGGAIVLTTPNIDGWMRREQGLGYYHYSTDHWLLHGHRSIEVVAERVGLDLVRLDDLGSRLLDVADESDWFAVEKYTKARDHLYAVLRVPAAR